MKTERRLGRLKLHRESLRLLSAVDLERARGAYSGVICGTNGATNCHPCVTSPAICSRAGAC